MAFVYHVGPRSLIEHALQHGLDPAQDPWADRRALIGSFFAITERLHADGFVMMRWWGKPVDQLQVARTTLADLERASVDFTNDASEIPYYLNLKGGALVATLRIYANELSEKRPPLTEDEWHIVRDVLDWTADPEENATIALDTGDPVLENAEVLDFGHRKHYRVRSIVPAERLTKIGPDAFE